MGASAVFILISLGCGVHILVAWPSVRWLVIVALLLSIALLVLSITDWCEHGNLLTSCCVMAFSMWLCYQAVDLPELKWVGIAICALSLTAFAFMPTLGSTAATSDAVPLAEGG